MSSPSTVELRGRAQRFVQAEIAPHAASWDARASYPESAIEALARAGWLGLSVPTRYGGGGLGPVALAIVAEELGRGCISTRTLLTVHAMVSHAIATWGSERQRERWLPELAAGRRIAAFALSEPDAGSDAASLRCELREADGRLLLTGCKRWISFAQRADLLLVFARLAGRVQACVVERESAGLEVRPIEGLLGSRASAMAELTFDACVVARDNLIAGAGFGFMGVGLSALDVGRLTVAAGSVGLAQACVDAAVDYAGRRVQGGARIGDHQLIRRRLADMRVETAAARALTLRAARAFEAGDDQAAHELMAAKYYAAAVANRAAADALQIHGARGYADDLPVERWLRDARCLTIIEGSSEVLQTLLGDPDANWGRA